MITGESQQFVGVLFGDGSCELAGVNEFESRGLFDHFGRDLTDTVPAEINGGRTGEIKIAVAVAVPNVDAFSADSGRKCLAEGSAQNGRAGLDSGRIVHRRIIAFRSAPPVMPLVLSS